MQLDLPFSSDGPADAAAPQRLWWHPRANRECRLDGQLLRYELQRARRRSIGFVVGDEGLGVRAPRWLPQAEIDAALHAKADWLRRKLHEQAQRLRRIEARRIDWRDGARVPFLGQPVQMQIDPRGAGVVLLAASAGAGETPRLRLGLPATATPVQIRDLVQSWLQRQARRVFEERCRHFAPRLGVQVRRLSLSSAQTRWGSASADGSIRLHWRLIHFALPVIDYVVAHELAHLRVMDHSPRFWDVVRSVLPDYAQANEWLRDETLRAYE